MQIEVTENLAAITLKQLLQYSRSTSLEKVLQRKQTNTERMLANSSRNSNLIKWVRLKKLCGSLKINP